MLDKHSTGGVGDKVSLILAPIVAAAGGFVPMISGRGLGHTGGTLDKLAAIPGYRTDLDAAQFQRVVREVGCAIIGPSADLAPADRRLYAVRDVTATVESLPLIIASILSKKLAAGLDGLVMDVKFGSGAFAASRTLARKLAKGIVAVGEDAGLKTAALITDMHQPLGRTAGNALEVAEALAFLQGAEDRDPRLLAVTLALAGELLALGGLASDAAAGPGEGCDQTRRRQRAGDLRPHGGGPGRPGRFRRSPGRLSAQGTRRPPLPRAAGGIHPSHGHPPDRPRRAGAGRRAARRGGGDRSRGRAQRDPRARP